MSSLHALHRFPIHGLKIDRSFIRELDVDPRTTELVRVIVAMGRALGVDVVAEGVETEAQLELLREMGCRGAQGFWFTEAVDGDRRGAVPRPRAPGAAIGVGDGPASRLRSTES